MKNELSDKINQTTKFVWDQWNTKKNWNSHKVTTYECEEVFFNKPIFGSIPLSEEKYKEERYFAFGQTNRGRLLSIVFTIRKGAIRVISARDMSRKERRATT